MAGGHVMPCHTAGLARLELGSINELVASLIKERPHAGVNTASELRARKKLIKVISGGHFKVPSALLRKMPELSAQNR